MTTKDRSRVARWLTSAFLLISACGDDTSPSVTASAGETEGTGGDETRGDDPSTTLPSTSVSASGTGDTTSADETGSSESDSDSDSDSDTNGPRCGDGVADGDEACDGRDLKGATCESEGFDGGTLSCSRGCELDLSQCSIATCGDGVIEGREECDGRQLGGATCESEGFDGGDISCTRNCLLDVSACWTAVCGNGTIEEGEECDGDALGRASCTSQGFDGGTLGCTATCEYDTSACTTCGDGEIDGAEQCDGNNLGGASCVSEGFDNGTLACANDCSFDTSGCVNFMCGNGVIEGTEACDGNDLDGETCQSQGFDGGTLACAANCVFDTSGCTTDAGDCCESNGSPGCNDASCQATVCAVDAFCCNTSWDGLCANLAADECGALCGGGGGAGDCCAANGTPGCEDASCQATVCGQDAFCCDNQWDGICASIANDECAVCGGGGGVGDCCAANGTPGCEDASCQATVCGQDAFCCDNQWDGICAGIANDECAVCGGGGGAGDCCAANGTPGCEDASCQATVCGQDAFCCNNQWDGICAGIANDECAVCGGGGPLTDCCAANGTPGCNDANCQATVCAQDAFCCNNSWDGICANIANNSCAVCGGGPSSDCCNANGTPGCDDAACQALICGQDAFCCTNSWDGICASAAQSQCGVCN